MARSDIKQSMISLRRQVGKSKPRTNCGLVRVILAVWFILLLETTALMCQESAAQKVHVADGEYCAYTQNAGGIGPFTPSVYNFRESWTLWRLTDGSLKVEVRETTNRPPTSRTAINFLFAFRQIFMC